MTALLPVLTLLIGLAIGALVGTRLASRQSGPDPRDPRDGWRLEERLDRPDHGRCVRTAGLATTHE